MEMVTGKYNTNISIVITERQNDMLMEMCNRYGTTRSKLLRYLIESQFSILVSDKEFDND